MQAGADIDTATKPHFSCSTDRGCQTPLMLAAAAGMVECVEELLRRNADPSPLDASVVGAVAQQAGGALGRSALDMALENGHFDCAEAIRRGIAAQQAAAAAATAPACSPDQIVWVGDVGPWVRISCALFLCSQFLCSRFVLSCCTALECRYDRSVPPDRYDEIRPEPPGSSLRL